MCPATQIKDFQLSIVRDDDPRQLKLKPFRALETVQPGQLAAELYPQLRAGQAATTEAGLLGVAEQRSTAAPSDSNLQQWQQQGVGVAVSVSDLEAAGQVQRPGMVVQDGQGIPGTTGSRWAQDAAGRRQGSDAPVIWLQQSHAGGAALEAQPQPQLQGQHQQCERLLPLPPEHKRHSCVHQHHQAGPDVEGTVAPPVTPVDFPADGQHQQLQQQQGLDTLGLRMRRAQELAARLRSECDVLKGAPRASKDDPMFVETFYRSSRLHFIGTWKARIEALLGNEVQEVGPAPVPPPGKQGGPGSTLSQHPCVMVLAARAVIDTATESSRLQSCNVLCNPTCTVYLHPRCGSQHHPSGHGLLLCCSCNGGAPGVPWPAPRHQSLQQRQGHWRGGRYRSTADCAAKAVW